MPSGPFVIWLFISGVAGIHSLSPGGEVSASQAILNWEKDFAGVIDAAFQGTLSQGLGLMTASVAENPALGRLEGAGSAEWLKDLDWAGRSRPTISIWADGLSLSRWKLVAEASGKGSLTTAGNLLSAPRVR